MQHIFPPKIKRRSSSPISQCTTRTRKRAQSCRKSGGELSTLTCHRPAGRAAGRAGRAEARRARAKWAKKWVRHVRPPNYGSAKKSKFVAQLMKEKMFLKIKQNNFKRNFYKNL